MYMCMTFYCGLVYSTENGKGYTDPATEKAREEYILQILSLKVLVYILGDQRSLIKVVIRN